jgi:uncharacterized DUF497 family protein
VIGDRFEWDDRKAAANLKKHGVSFELATLAFDDPLSAILSDSRHSLGEYRYTILGVPPEMNTLLAVAYVLRDPRIRIINARYATSKERRRYMNQDFDRISDQPPADDFEMLPEYDFRGAVRGLVYIPGTWAVRLDKDVAAVFRTPKAVNDALRQLIADGRVHSTD